MCKDNNNKKLIAVTSKLSAYILDWGSGYSKQAIDEVKIIFYSSKIYALQTLRILVLYLYHFYLNHPCGGRLAENILEVYY